jgi:hypothetical protein
MCLRTFCTLPTDASTVLSFTDAAAPRSLVGHNDVNSCAVWAYNGKRKVCVVAHATECDAQVTPVEYARCVRVLRPTFAQLPIDTDVFACAATDSGAGGKRMIKAVESTRTFGEQVLAELMSSVDGGGDAGADVNGSGQHQHVSFVAISSNMFRSTLAFTPALLAVRFVNTHYVQLNTPAHFLHNTSPAM